jgi:hypothetical protein
MTVETKSGEEKKVKTTVSIPAKVLDTLQLYIAKTPRANFHDQSSVVILALVEYLNNRMETKDKIDPTHILDDKVVKKFLVIPDDTT